MLEDVLVCYWFSEVDVVVVFVKLDCFGVIELCLYNCYWLKVVKMLCWWF